MRSKNLGSRFHPASLTIAAMTKVVFLTLMTDPLVVVASILLALGFHGFLRSHPLRHLAVASLGALATGLGMGMTHGFFPGPGANPSLAWAFGLRPLGMVLWSLVLSSGDRLDWAHSLHRFWRLPLSWVHGCIAALRFVPLLQTEGKLVRAWRRLHGKKGGTTVTLLVRALRLGAQASLALQARTLGRAPLRPSGRGGENRNRTWLRAMEWHYRDTALVVLTVGSIVALLLGAHYLGGGIRLWDARF